jgi:hypothetical protein
MKVCGIDPGNSGAICVLDTVYPVPALFLDLKKHTVYETVKWLHAQQVQSIWIEDVHSLFGMSAKSNFGFGRNLGTIIAIAEMVAADSIVVNKVTPKIWQKYAGVTSKGKAIKANVAQLVLTMYPSATIHGAKGGLLDGRSDALMIAHYGANYKE